MLVLRLPNLFAGRDLADSMLDRLERPFAHETVVVDARQTSSGSPTFASQLVQRTLVDGGADALVVGAPVRFAKHVTESARASSVAGSLDDAMPSEIAPAVPA